MTKTSENKRFSTKSNVRRAARTDGLELDQIEIMQDGAQFYYVRLSEQAEATEAEVEVTETEIETDAELVTNGTSSERELMLMDGEGGEYGRVTEADAENMATMLAASEQRMIQVVDKATLEPVLMVEYHAEEPAQVEPQAPVEVEASQVTTESTVEPTDAVCDTMLVVRIAGSVTEARDMAEKIAKLVRGTVEIVDAGTGEVQAEIAHKAVRVVVDNGGAKTATRKDLPTGKMGELVKLCMRDEGASKAEMLAATGWKMMAGDTVQKVAAKYGLTFAKSADGKNKRYFLYRDEAQQVAA